MYLHNSRLSAFHVNYINISGPGSSVGIASGYGIDRPGSNPGGGDIFRTCPDWPWGQPSFLYNGYRVFQGVKCSRGVMLTPHPLQVQRSKKSRDITVLPLWAVQPVQSLSACTRVHFTFLILCNVC